MATWIVAIACLLVGGILGGFFVWMWMSLVIAGNAFDPAHGDEGEDFLSEPVEVERRSISRWSGVRIVP